ncbi:CHAT domain-containing protein [Streptomyces sp. NPDC002514]|uniref:CHAT domain-containing protein n=1 Tax=Streptomyces sp. NPDC001270 TaxID=3364554 RepID=UPI00369104D8
MAQDLAVEIVRDPSHGFTGVPQRRGEARRAPQELRVMVREDATDTLRIEVSAPRPRAPHDREWHSARLETPAHVLWDLGVRLRALWSDLVVRHQSPHGDYGGQVGGFPLARTADLSEYATLTESLARKLADQGHALLQTMLEGNSDELCLVRDFLTSALTERGSLRVSFASCVHLPWSMLAVDPAECADPWEAFLGHRHQLEQGGDDGWDHAPLGLREHAATSLNKDTALDHVGRAAEVHRLLDQRSRLVVRTRSDELLEALSQHVLNEDIMYFWCHGHLVDGGGSGFGLSVSLSDAERIDGPAVSWRRRRIPRTAQARFRPFVLLNACHTGRGAAPGSLKHLGQELRAMGAEGVLAPQIEIPQVFATEYAYAFLEMYLTGEHTAGEINQLLAQHFARKYHNPLGLTYSLHCGINSRLDLAS